MANFRVSGQPHLGSSYPEGKVSTLNCSSSDPPEGPARCPTPQVQHTISESEAGEPVRISTPQPERIGRNCPHSVSLPTAPRGLARYSSERGPAHDLRVDTAGEPVGMATPRPANLPERDITALQADLSRSGTATPRAGQSRRKNSYTELLFACMSAGSASCPPVQVCRSFEGCSG